MENSNKISYTDGFFQLDLSIRLNPDPDRATPRKKPRIGENNEKIEQRQADEKKKNAETELNDKSVDTDNGVSEQLKALFQEHKDNPENFFLMTQSLKGKLIIINNDFQKTDRKRVGSKADIDNLEETFSSFSGKTAKISISVERNLSSRDIIKRLKLFVDTENLPSFFAVVLMSHGTCVQGRDGGLTDMIYGNDNTAIPVKEVIAIFDQDRLKEIPVLMFFQMCRGSKRGRAELRAVERADEDDHENVRLQRSAEVLKKSFRDLLANVLPGVKFITPGEETNDEIDSFPQSSEDVDDEPAVDHAREKKNMLVSFSTSEGYVSKRNTKTGTWFIQALCDELKKNGDKKDIREIMEEVHRVVHEKQGTGIACDTGHTLNKEKKLYFFPGLP